MNTPKPPCKLVGTDGNIFSLAGRVTLTLKRAGQADKAREFQDRLSKSKSYGDALQLMMEYVDVE